MMLKILKQDDDIAFTKVSLPYGWMGNMSPYPLEYECEVWPTSEHLFQALRYPEDHPVKELIRKQKSPMLAKMTAKKKIHSVDFIVEPRSDQDVENMMLCLKLKFSQHQNIRKHLKECEGQIIEDTTNRQRPDQFWGAKLVGDFWEGENVLGMLLMVLRDELNNK